MSVEIRTNIVRTGDGRERHEIYSGDRHLGTVFLVQGTPPTWHYRIDDNESLGYPDADTAAFALLDRYRQRSVEL